MNFYPRAEEALTTHRIEEKEAIVAELLRYCSTEDPLPGAGFTPRIFTAPSYAKLCRIVDPRDLPKRRSPASAKGLATTVHAIAHIEYSAVDLAIDAVYRFPEMPREYKYDWLEVAAQEIRHFRMLEGILEDLGYRYGDFPVHRGLFDASVHTAEDVLERMAVIPRHYEATGLDVNPQIMRKLEPHAANPHVRRLLEALGIIYDEEIDHVRKGDRWFRYCCAQRGLEPSKTFQEILQRYDLKKKRRGGLNVAARKAAGFACAELRDLGAERCDE